MKLFQNKTISFVYRLCIILKKIRTKQTSPRTFFKIIAYAMKLPLVFYHAKTTMPVITHVRKIKINCSFSHKMGYK